MPIEKASETVVDSFIQTAQNHQDTLAVIHEGKTYTYKDLYYKGCGVAKKLKTLGIQKDQIVGVYSERSFDQIAAYIGIWLIGAVYLPIDPKNPSNRITSMLHTSDCRTILIGRISEMQKLEMIQLLSRLKIKPVLMTQVEPCLPEQICPIALKSTDPAYVFFTSGSTGEPKGVLAGHAGISNLVHWYLTRHHYQAKERFSMLASPGFDASISEIWPVLSVGGTLCIPEADLIINPKKLMEWFCRNKISAGYIPTVILEHIFELQWPAEHSPRVLFTGGDRLRKYPPDNFPCPVVNQYGPTEATDICIEFSLQPGMSCEGAPPIGFPIDNVDLVVVDDSLNKVPRGQKGELLIGGTCLAQGYLNDPHTTGQKFITKNARRFYRTGDIVWQDADRVYKFEGRTDFQVQVLGQRVELGEVEKKILELAFIRNAAVALKTINGQDVLTAYYTLDRMGEIPQNDLIEQLKGVLPDYMIPKRWIRMQALPVSLNGKIDRRALPDPVIESRKIIPPSNPTEIKIAEFFEGLLNLSAVSVLDNFFHIGGNSLLGGILLGKINDHFGKEFPLSVLMESNTIKDLAKLVAQEAFLHEGQNIIPIRRGGIGIPLFCVHGFGGYVFRQANLAQAISPKYPYYVIQGCGIDSYSKPHDSIYEMAETYVQGIRSVQNRGPYRILGYSLGGLVGIEIARILMKKGQEIDFLGLVDTYGPDYPKVLPLPRRIWNHINNLLFEKKIDRSNYIRTRFDNIIRRINKFLNRPHKLEYDEFLQIQNPVSDELYLAHEKAAETYTAAPLDLKVILFRALKDPEYPGTDFSDPYMGWQPYFKKGVVIKSIDGDHFSLFNPTIVNKLGKLIEESYDINKPISPG